jgi:hypothetical protein
MRWQTKKQHMSKHRKKKRTHQPNTGQPSPRLICGWCGEAIQSGEESDNLYEPDEAYAGHIPTAMAYVHTAHMPEEDHPFYEQMPYIGFTGLPGDLADAR